MEENKEVLENEEVINTVESVDNSVDNSKSEEEIVEKPEVVEEPEVEEIDIHINMIVKTDETHDNTGRHLIPKMKYRVIGVHAKEENMECTLRGSNSVMYFINKDKLYV